MALLISARYLSVQVGNSVWLVWALKLWPQTRDNTKFFGNATKSWEQLTGVSLGQWGESFPKEVTEPDTGTSRNQSMLSLFICAYSTASNSRGWGGVSESLEGVLFSFIYRLEEDIGSPGVTGGCEPPNMVAESWTWSLCKSSINS